MTSGSGVARQRIAGWCRSCGQLGRIASRPLLVTATCGPLAAAGSIAAARSSWLGMAALSTAGVGVSAGVALLVTVGRQISRSRVLVAAGCALLVWWALLGVIGLPLVAPWALLAAALTGGSAGLVILARTRHRLRLAREAKRSPTAFVAQAPRYQTSVLADTPDDELYRLWEESGRAVRLAEWPTALADHSDFRRLLLTELERRDPGAFAAWTRYADVSHIRGYRTHRAHRVE